MTSKQEFESRDMGSEKSFSSETSLESQAPLGLHQKDGDGALFGDKNHRSAINKSKLKASASSFRPRSETITLKNSGRNSPALPQMSQAPSNGPARTFSPFEGQLVQVAQGVLHPFATQILPHCQLDHQPPMDPTSFSPYGHMVPDNSYGQHRLNRNPGQQVIHSQHNRIMTTPNSTLRGPYATFGTPGGMAQPSQMMDFSTAQNGIAGMFPYHLKQGHGAMRKMHGGNQYTVRHGMANRQRGTNQNDMDLGFKFPVSRAPRGEPAEAFGSQYGGSQYTGATQSTDGDANKIDSNYLAVPTVVGNVTGHTRHYTAIRVPQAQDLMMAPQTSHTPATGTEQLGPVTSPRINYAIPFSATPDRPVLGHERSQSVNEQGFVMSGNSSPRHRRNPSGDLLAKYGSPPVSGLSGPNMAILNCSMGGVTRNFLQSELTFVPINSLDDKSMKFKRFVFTFNQETGNPTFQSAMEYLPLCSQLDNTPRPNYGVLRLSNVPFGVKRSEVLAFLGRGAKLVPESEGEPIHIIMDRLTGKTMDAYVEFVSLAEATHSASRYISYRNGGRRGRLGERYVDVEVVNPASMMEQLFPKTKHVIWQGYHASISAPDPGNRFDAPFKGFVTPEELNMIFAHIQNPFRSPFNKACPQRPYEALVSIMVKMPWHMTGYILVKDRNSVWRTVLESIIILKATIGEDVKNDNLCLTPQLLNRMCNAVRKCHGFNIAQKHEIHQVAGINTHWTIPHPEDWIWQALGPVKTLADETDMVSFYMALIRKLSTKDLSLEHRRRISEDLKKDKLDREFNNGAWGAIKIDYPPNWEELTMDHIASLEWAAIQNCLRGLE